MILSFHSVVLVQDKKVKLLDIIQVCWQSALSLTAFLV